MRTISYLIFALIVSVIVLVITGCTVTYSAGAWTASANGREIGRAIQVIAEK